MNYCGGSYQDNCPPPPGVDADGGFPTPSRDVEQRDRERARRHDHRDNDYRSERRDRYSYNERDSDYQDYYEDESYNRRNRYEGRRSSNYTSDGHEREDRRGYRDRERQRDYDRDRGYSDRERSRARDHSRERGWDRDRERPRDDWREEIPNNTIMVRNLGPDTTEADIREEIIRYGLQPKDIRLMRKKESSRSFAFVEFNLLSEAVRWKELTQGLVFFDGQCRSTLHYSIPKDTMNSDRSYGKTSDWTCSKCGVSNFRRRDLCFKCNSPRDDSEMAERGDGQDEVSSYPSNTLLFRNLDVLTTEERVLSMLGQLTMLPIKSLKVAKDSMTNTSRGFAFVELHSTSEATQLHDLLLSMAGNFFVDGRQVTVSYARRSLTSMNGSASANAASVALAAAQWTNQDSNNDSLLQNVGGHGSSSLLTSSDFGNIVVDGITYKQYSVPDMSTYKYDENSGYYYDSTTGLYYDSNSQYYYNSENQQYLYWDGDKQTYLPAPGENKQSKTCGDTVPVSASTELSMTPAVLQAEPKLNSDESKKEYETPTKGVKQDKVKIAKKIAKDMEKWAKTLNQKKENAKLGFCAPAAPAFEMFPNQMSTADAGFAVLEKKSTAAERSALVAEILAKSNEESNLQLTNSTSEKPILVAAYGGESDSDGDTEFQEEGNRAYDLLKEEESKLTDWDKLACLMCKRQFGNKETLLRHQQFSDLHKQNLDVVKLTKLSQRQMEELARRERDVGYRDRAKERRKKFGQPDAPPPNRLKNRYLKGREEQINQAEQPTKDGIGADNIGNKMLKAMGWTEGRGLGKTGQGMSGIIEVQQRSKTAGLGMKGSSYGATAGDSYKDAVKKAMQARFKEISEE